MKYVAYYRVSTKEQGRTHYGLDAQQEAIHKYLGRAPDVELEEVRSGTETNRPVLLEAFRLCKESGAKLIVARLDRLSRNMRYTAEIMDRTDVGFVACDHPNADRLVLHIMAAVGEDRARTISKNTRAGLAQAKKKGVILGQNGKRLHRRAQEFAEELRSTFEFLDGHSYRKIADHLNDEEIPAFSGGPWNATSVMRTIRRLEA